MSPVPHARRATDVPADEYAEDPLDAALEMTFPASDPVAVHSAAERPPRREGDRRERERQGAGDADE